MFNKVLCVSFIIICTGLFNPRGQCATELSRYDKARQRVVFLLEQNNYDDGEEAANALTELFGSNMQTADTLFGVVQRYEWAKRFDHAKRIYGQVIARYPGSPLEEKAKIGIARIDILSLIASEKYKDASVAIERIANDFAKNPELPETLFQISERYKWLSKFDEQKRICQMIIQKFPESPFASKAKVTIAGADAMSYAMAKDFSKAFPSVDKIIADYKDNPDLPEVLYLVAERCEWGDRYSEAKSIYQKLITNFPNSTYAAKASLRTAAADVILQILNLNSDQADKNLAKMIEDFKDNPDLQSVALIIGEKYYRERKNTRRSRKGKEGI